jgi:hypothetical protein
MPTTLTIDPTGQRFCLGGRATFLLGASYFAGAGASQDFLEDDLADLKMAGVNWIRVWATWAAFANDVSAVDREGYDCKPWWDNLVRLVAFADKLGLAVDVTLSRGDAVAGAGMLATDAAHLNAAACLAEGLKGYRNVWIDLANERNAADSPGVPIAFVRTLRDRVKELDPQRLVTASHAGDIDPDRLYEYIMSAKVDFLAPHRPRAAGSPAQTEQKTATLRARMARLGKVVPVLFQEPFRRGVGDWQPAADDFLADLAGAVAGGAAGWCFHNGHAAAGPDGRPRRCFDLRPAEGRLIDQLEDTERAVLRQMGKIARGVTG